MSGWSDRADGSSSIIFTRTTITIGDPGRTFVERVRLFESSDPSAPCTGAGLVVDAMAGDCDGSALRDESPRTIRFARWR